MVYDDYMLYKADQAVCIHLFDQIRNTLRSSEIGSMSKISNMADMNTNVSTQEEETPRVSSTLQSLLLMPKLLKFAEMFEKLDLKHTNTYTALLAAMHINSSNQ